LPEPVGVEKEREILALWLEGNKSMDEIAMDTGVVKSTVFNVISRERERTPELDDLKALREKLLHDKTNSVDTARASSYLVQVEALGVHMGPKETAGAIELVKKYEEKVHDAIEAGKFIKGLEEKEKKTYSEILLDVKDAQATLGNLRTQLAQINREIEQKTSKLGTLSEYEKLKAGLDDLAMSPQGMNGFIAFHKQLVALGFMQQDAAALATELKNKNLLPKDAAEVLTKALQDYTSLNEAVRELGRQKTGLESDLVILNTRKGRTREACENAGGPSW